MRIQVIVWSALVALEVLGGEATGQAAGRPYAGVLGGWQRESADWVDGGSPAAGAVAGVGLFRSLGVEVEVSRPARTFVRQYEGISVTFAPPGASRDEIERLGVYTRFRHERTIDSVVSVGMSYGRPVHPRWTPRVFVGATNHHVTETETFTPLRIPEGLTPSQVVSAQFREQRMTHNLGSLTFGGDVAFTFASHLSLAPAIRYDFGSLGDEINNSLRVSLRMLWTF
jgi:hypothetical protein